MIISCQFPRKSEAEVTELDDGEYEIKPRFYAKQGLASALYITVANNDGDVLGHYLVKANGDNGQLKLFRLKEETPRVDRKEEKND